MLDEVLDERELVGDLRAAEDAPTTGRSGASKMRPSASSSWAMSRPATAGRRWRVMRLDRRVRAVGRGERVVDVDSASAARAAREAVVVGLLLRMEAEVLQHQHLPGPSARAGASTSGPMQSRRQRHGPAEQLAEPRRPRAAASTWDRACPCGRPRWEARTSDGPALEAVLDRRQGGGDARVVGDAAAVERDVEVHPQEDALAGALDLVDALLRHELSARVGRGGVRAWSTAVRRHAEGYSDAPCSGSGRARGRSTPTRCRTRPAPSRACRRRWPSTAGPRSTSAGCR